MIRVNLYFSNFITSYNIFYKDLNKFIYLIQLYIYYRQKNNLKIFNCIKVLFPNIK